MSLIKNKLKDNDFGIIKKSLSLFFGKNFFSNIPNILEFNPKIFFFLDLNEICWNIRLEYVRSVS